MRLFDTHCHVDALGPDDDAILVQLHEARDAGVRAILLPAVAPDQWERCAQLAAAHPDLIHLALGIHPQCVRELDDQALHDALDRLPDLLLAHGAVAVGEVGLDLRWDTDALARQRQRVALTRQLTIAHDLGLPPLLHCLDAHAMLLQLWREHPICGHVMGVMHSYSGSAELVRDYARQGMWFSFAGGITWHHAKRAPRAALAVPLDRLLIETDAPYQPPHPLDGGPNRPARQLQIAQRLAQLRQLPLHELAELTWRNAHLALGLPLT